MVSPRLPIAVLRVLLGILAGALAGSSALAALGETPDGIARLGIEQLRSARTLTDVPIHAGSPPVSTRQAIDARGVAITEYSSAGIVFAVTWRGPALVEPDAVLGLYFEDYRSARLAQGRTGRNAPITVSTERIVVRQWGHMRAHSGLAYLPAKVPSGFNVDNLKAQ